jgi:hypothetical protein
VQKHLIDERFFLSDDEIGNSNDSKNQKLISFRVIVNCSAPIISYI